MPFKIAEYTEAMVPEVIQFNRRLEAGGLNVQFPVSHVPDWLPKVPGRKVFQQYYLALDERSAVRGAYVLKHQDFWIGGQSLSIADFRLPISEGAVNRAFAQLGVQLLLDAQHRQPLLFGLGMGGATESLPRLLKASAWHVFSLPLFFRIVRPAGFLRNIAYLRRSPPKRWLLDFMALSGLGWIAVRGLQTLRSPAATWPRGVEAQPVDEFADWADRLWEAAKAEYGMSAVRDAQTLQTLYPKDDEKFIRLKVSRKRVVIGWAVLLNTQLSAHRQFGNMRLGSIVDCFSAPADAADVAAMARSFLESHGVDLIVSNQSHAAWCRALDSTGFMRGPSNFLLASSRKLTELLRASGVEDHQIHMNRGDGDGPINL